MGRRRGRLGARRGAGLRHAAARGPRCAASTGQDTRRGTFGHRNAALVDYRTGEECVPLEHLATLAPATSTGPTGRFFIYDSLLSEYAALGFEYGYSLVQRDGLVAWEAQFGDFVNGAQIIIDQFLAAAEIKWAQTSGLVLLLPHGYEGQGAEHSSARMERFLDLCAEDNIQVADVTTAAQLFHLLRRQVRRTEPQAARAVHPQAVPAGQGVLQPGRGVRHRALPRGARRPRPSDRSGQVRRVVLATGKVAIDAAVARDKAGATDVAIVRVEQLHPWPEDQIADVLAGYEHADRRRLAAGGAGEHGRLELRPGPAAPAASAATSAFERVSRVASGSPATGSHAMHELEQEDLLQRALGAPDALRRQRSHRRTRPPPPARPGRRRGRPP